MGSTRPRPTSQVHAKGAGAALLCGRKDGIRYLFSDHHFGSLDGRHNIVAGDPFWETMTPSNKPRRP
jgi:hypothetical protein